LTGGVQAWLLSSEITLFGLPTLWFGGEGNTVRRANASGASDPRSQRTGACTQTLYTETGGSTNWSQNGSLRSALGTLTGLARDLQKWEVGQPHST
jgi:hypothetical protein